MFTGRGMANLALNLRHAIWRTENNHQIVDLERTSNYLDSSDWSVVEVFVKHLAFLSFRTLQEIKANKDSEPSLHCSSGCQLCRSLYHQTCREAHLSMLEHWKAKPGPDKPPKPQTWRNMRRRGNLRFPLLDHVGDTLGELSIIHATDHDPCLVSALYYEPNSGRSRIRY
jgi:hypothetical protein